MKICVALFPLRAHFNTLFGILRELGARGHDIEVLCPELGRSAYCMAALDELGLGRFDPAAQGTGEIGSVVPSASSWQAIVSDADVQLSRYRDAMQRLAEQTPTIRAHLERARPDVIVLDPMLFQVVGVAEALGVPWVAVHSCLSAVAPPDIDCPRLHAEQTFGPARRAYFDDLKATYPEFRYLNAISPRLNVVLHSTALIGSLPPTPGLHCVGPSMRRPRDPELVRLPEPLEGSGPLVYVAFGSMANEDIEVYRRSIRACRALGARALVSCPPRMQAELEGLGAVRTTDQLRALELADVHLGYPGAVTLMESMAFGCPVLALPHLADHAIQGHFISARGVGRVLPYSTGQSALTEALDEVLSEELRARAAIIAEDYRKRDGAREASDLIEAALRG